jgi:DNA-binding IclR family transcriptional regulator
LTKHKTSTIIYIFNNIEVSRNMEDVPVRSVKKALDALDFIVESGAESEGATLTEIAGCLGERLTTARNILRTMETCGYLTRAGKLYAAGPKCGDLLRAGALSPLFKNLASAAAREAALQTGESFVLTSLSRGKRIVLGRFYGDSELCVNLGADETKAPYELVTTHALLAFASAAERALFIRVNGPPGDEARKTYGFSDYSAWLDEQRKRGFAEMRSQSVLAYAAPIMSGSNIVLGALGAHAPAFRMDEAGSKKLLEALLAAAEKIKAAL